MQANVKYFILLAIFLRTVQMLNLNCLQVPAKHIGHIQTCCRFPRFKLHVFDAQCSQVATKSGIFGLDRYFNPCALACVFNASALMESRHALSLPRVQQLLERVLDDRHWRDTYYRSFQTCLPLVRNKADSYTAKGRTAVLDGRKCSNLPIMYGICAQAQTYLNCPPKSWTDSRLCNETRKFLTHCMQQM